MNEYDYQQGSPEWHALRRTMFTASEAPAMMGVSKYKTRSALLREKHTGETEEVTSSQQYIFDKGHDAEAAIRSHVERLIGEELFPTTGVSSDHPKLLASFDGLTMDNSINFEHKLHNKALVEAMMGDDLPPHYYWQLEQQMLVSGAIKTIFVCSDGTPDKCHVLWYKPVPGRAEQLLAGWEQFAADLEAYAIPDDAPEKVVAEPIAGLPALKYTMNGMALTSNLEEYKAAAEAMVLKATGICQTDQDFANAEALGKEFKKAEDKIKTLREMVLSEVEDIDQFTKDLAYIGEQFRQARLASDKQVKAQKESIRAEMVKAQADALGDWINDLCENAPLPLRVTLPVIDFDFRQCIKGKRTIQSVQSALDDRAAALKIEIVAAHNRAIVNHKSVAAILEKYDYLFPDLNNLIHTDTEQFHRWVSGRVEEDIARKEAAEAAEKARILAEQAAAAAITAEIDTSPAAAVAQSIKATDIAPVDILPQTILTEPSASSDMTSPDALIYQWAKKWDVDAEAVSELLKIIQRGKQAA